MYKISLPGRILIAAAGLTSNLIAAVAPSDLAYPADSVVYALNVTIAPLAPTVTGTVTGYAIAPALPAGLVLSATTGTLTGTPTQTSGITAYTVTASNQAGETQATLKIRTFVAPTLIAYVRDSVIATAAITIVPDTPRVVGGSAPVHFAIAPAPPAGLKFDTLKGILSGKPLASSALATYTVTVSNSGGATSVPLYIRVLPPAPPTAVHYGSNTFAFTLGQAILPLMPTPEGYITHYSVSPPLPVGLSLNADSGIIAGTPVEAFAGTYLVTASNEAGATQCTLTLSAAYSVWKAYSEGYARSYFPSPDIGYSITTTSGNVSKTTDGGKTWVVINNSLPGEYQIAYFFNPSVGFIYGTEGRTFDPVMRRTRDGGATWQAPNTPLDLNPQKPVGMYFTSDSVGYLVGTTYTTDVSDPAPVLKTTNGGAKWTQQTIAGKPPLSAVSFVDANTGFVAGPGGKLAKTTNAGTAWTLLTSATTRDLNGLHCVGSLCRAVGAQGVIVISNDAGATWTEMQSTTQKTLRAVHFTGNLGFAVGDSGTLIRSTDGGLTWKQEPLPLSTDMRFVYASPQVSIASGGGVTYRLDSRPPSGLAYTPDSLCLRTGIALPKQNAPFYVGGPSTFSASPSLPAGLQLQDTTGVLSGTPLAAASRAAYTVTASNTAGSTQAVLYIEVLNPLNTLSYGADTMAFTIGTPLAPDTPSVSNPVTRYSVAPGLPTGLTLDTLTGVLSGTPSGPPTTGLFIFRALMQTDTAKDTLVLKVSASTALARLITPDGVRLLNGVLTYRLEKAAPVRLRLLDLRGTTIWSLDQPLQKAGSHAIVLPLGHLERSVYLLDFRAGTERFRRRIVAE